MPGVNTVSTEELKDSIIAAIDKNPKLFYATVIFTQSVGLYLKYIFERRNSSTIKLDERAHPHQDKGKKYDEWSKYKFAITGCLYICGNLFKKITPTNYQGFKEQSQKDELIDKVLLEIVAEYRQITSGTSTDLVQSNAELNEEKILQLFLSNDGLKKSELSQLYGDLAGKYADLLSKSTPDKIATVVNALVNMINVCAPNNYLEAQDCVDFITNTFAAETKREFIKKITKEPLSETKSFDLADMISGNEKLKKHLGLEHFDSKDQNCNTLVGFIFNNIRQLKLSDLALETSNGGVQTPSVEPQGASSSDDDSVEESDSWLLVSEDQSMSIKDRLKKCVNEEYNRLIEANLNNSDVYESFAHLPSSNHLELRTYTLGLLYRCIDNRNLKPDNWQDTRKAVEEADLPTQYIDKVIVYINLTIPTKSDLEKEGYTEEEKNQVISELEALKNVAQGSFPFLADHAQLKKSYVNMVFDTVSQETYRAFLFKLSRWNVATKTTAVTNNVLIPVSSPVQNGVPQQSEGSGEQGVILGSSSEIDKKSVESGAGKGVVVSTEPALNNTDIIANGDTTQQTPSPLNGSQSTEEIVTDVSGQPLASNIVPLTHPEPETLANSIAEKESVGAAVNQLSVNGNVSGQQYFVGNLSNDLGSTQQPNTGEGTAKLTTPNTIEKNRDISAEIPLLSEGDNANEAQSAASPSTTDRLPQEDSGVESGDENRGGADSPKILTQEMDRLPVVDGGTDNGISSPATSNSEDEGDALGHTQTHRHTTELPNLPNVPAQTPKNPVIAPKKQSHFSPAVKGVAASSFGTAALATAGLAASIVLNIEASIIACAVVAALGAVVGTGALIIASSKLSDVSTNFTTPQGQTVESN